MALLLERLHAAVPVSRAVIQLFEPASERGNRGVDELHQQTLNLFAFRGMPKEVYDEQVSFNLLARYGEDAPMAAGGGGGPPSSVTWLRCWRSIRRRRRCRRCG